MIDVNANIKYYGEKLLGENPRKGMKETLTHLRELGFFNAPASSSFHLNEPGGLATHSINVYEMAMSIKSDLVARKPELADRLPDESIAIAALLHDVCKAEIYKEGQKWRKDEQGRWESYRGYTVDYSDFPMGHGEKSVIRLLKAGLDLTDDEMMAIRWHMSAWGLAFQNSEECNSLNAAREKCPLVSLIQAADVLAAGVLEV